MYYVMKRVLCLCALGAFLCMPAVALGQVPWSDDFDSYANDSSLHGQGGWKGWDNDPAWTGYVRDDQPKSAPHSLESMGDTDLIHEYPGVEEGTVVYSAWAYVPDDLVPGGSDGNYFIMQNLYNDGGPYAWVVQVWFDPTTGLFTGTFGSSAESGTPYLPNSWNHIEVTFYMYDDWVQVRLNGTLLDDPALADHDTLGGGYTNSGGVFGGDGSAVDVASVDLFAFGASEIYYDDLSLTQLDLTGRCCVGDNCIEVTGPDCDAQGGTYYGTGLTCAGFDCGTVGTPTVSEWGLIIMTLLVLTAGTVILRHRHRPATA